MSKSIINVLRMLNATSYCGLLLSLVPQRRCVTAADSRVGIGSSYATSSSIGRLCATSCASTSLAGGIYALSRRTASLDRGFLAGRGRLSCVVAVGRSHQTIFSLARDSIVGLVAPRFEVISTVSLALVAASVDKDYSRVNFALLWRFLRLANSLALTLLLSSNVRLVFSDFMCVEGTQSMAAEVGATLPVRNGVFLAGSAPVQLRPFSHLVFARGKRSLQRRSRRRVASLRLGRILNVSPR